MGTQKLTKFILTLILIFTCFSQAYESTLTHRLDSLAPLRIDLPSVQDRIDSQASSFAPVYGSVTDIRVLNKVQEQLFYGGCAWVYNDSPYINYYTADSNFTAEEDLFKKWSNAYLQQQWTLKNKRPNTIELHHWEISTIQATIRVEKIYDKQAKQWTNPGTDSTATLTMFTLNGPFYHEGKNGEKQVWQHSYFIPQDSTKRIFFNNGFSQAMDISSSPLDSVKVLPYKYTINVPFQEVLNVRQKISAILDSKKYNRLSAEIDKAKEVIPKDHIYHGLGFDYTNYLKILAGDFSDLKDNEHDNDLWTSSSPYFGIILGDGLEYKISEAFREYVSSPQFEENLAKEKSPLNRALARIKVAEYTYKVLHIEPQQDVSDIVESYLDSIESFDQKMILAQYWRGEEMSPNYIYFSYQATASHFLGKLDNIAEPGKGFGVAFGFGNNKRSFDVSLAGYFWAGLKKDAARSPYLKDKDWRDYDFDMLDIGIVYTHKWLVTKHFEGGIYAGPTLNMTEIVNRDSDSELPDDVNLPNREIFLGIDLGLSFSLFEAFTKKDVKKMHTSTMYKGGRFGGKLKLGISSQNATETFDIFGWKAYAALELTLRAHASTRPAKLVIK